MRKFFSNKAKIDDRKGCLAGSATAMIGMEHAGAGGLLTEGKLIPTTENIQSGYADQYTTQTVTNSASSLLFKNGLNISAKGNVYTSKNMNDSNTTTKYEHEDIDVDYGSLTKSAAITGAIAGVSEVASEKILEMSAKSGTVSKFHLTATSNADESLLLKSSSYEQSSMIKAPTYAKTDWSWVAKADDFSKNYSGINLFSHKVYPGIGFLMRQSMEASVPSEENNSDILAK